MADEELLGLLVGPLDGFILLFSLGLWLGCSEGLLLGLLL